MIGFAIAESQLDRSASRKSAKVPFLSLRTAPIPIVSTQIRYPGIVGSAKEMAAAQSSVADEAAKMTAKSTALLVDGARYPNRAMTTTP
eukprot:gene22283-22346_t